MPGKIARVTASQEMRYGEWIGRYVQMGLNTTPADFPRATVAVLRMYEMLGLSKPDVILHLGSPYACSLSGEMMFRMAVTPKPAETSVRSLVLEKLRVKIGAQIGAQVGAAAWALIWESVGAVVNALTWNRLGIAVRSQLRDLSHGPTFDRIRHQLLAQISEQATLTGRPTMPAATTEQLAKCTGDGWANHYGGSLGDIGWVAFVSFMRDVIGVHVDESFSIEEELAGSCGWIGWYENAVAISDRPTAIHRNATGQLHCSSGPSITYRDGCRLHHLHGEEPPAAFRQLINRTCATV
jgi:hypothetical protein